MISDFSVVLLLVVAVLFCGLLHSRFSKRRIYKEIEELNGPKSLPLIGDVHVFRSINTNRDAVEVFMKILNTYEMPMKLKINSMLCYVTIEPEEIKILLNHPKALKKGILYDVLEGVIPDSLFLADVPKWRRMRKIMSPFFTKKFTDNYHQNMANQAQMLVHDLQQFVGKGYVDVGKTLKMYFMESLCENVFEVSMDFKNREVDYGGEIDRFFEMVFLKTSKMPYQIGWLYKMSDVYREEMRIKKLSLDLALEILKAKESESFGRNTDDESANKSKSSFLEKLLELKEHNQMSDDEICIEIIMFIVGGTDTVTAALGFTLLCLGMHSDIQEKLHKEILEVVGPGKQLQLEDIPKLTYTNVVIKEVLRLFPAPILLSRQLTDDVDIGSRVLPSGISCIIPTLYMQRHPKFWKDPLKFNPERFLSEETEKRHPYTLLPFSAGARNCIGERYAVLILKVSIVAIIQKLKIKCDYKSIEEIELISNPTLKSSTYVCAFENRSY